MIRSLIALQLWYQIRQEKKTKKKNNGRVGRVARPHPCTLPTDVGMYIPIPFSMYITQDIRIYII